MPRCVSWAAGAVVAFGTLVGSLAGAAAPAGPRIPIAAPAPVTTPLPGMTRAPGAGSATGTLPDPRSLATFAAGIRASYPAGASVSFADSVTVDALHWSATGGSLDARLEGQNIPWLNYSQADTPGLWASGAQTGASDVTLSYGGLVPGAQYAFGCVSPTPGTETVKVVARFRVKGGHTSSWTRTVTLANNRLQFPLLVPADAERSERHTVTLSDFLFAGTGTVLRLGGCSLVQVTASVPPIGPPNPTIDASAPSPASSAAPPPPNDPAALAAAAEQMRAALSLGPPMTPYDGVPVLTVDFAHATVTAGAITAVLGGANIRTLNASGLSFQLGAPLHWKDPEKLGWWYYATVDLTGLTPGGAYIMDCSVAPEKLTSVDAGLTYATTKPSAQLGNETLMLWRTRASIGGDHHVLVGFKVPADLATDRPFTFFIDELVTAYGGIVDGTVTGCTLRSVRPHA